MEIMPADISRIQNYLESQGVIFLFTGPLSQSVLKDIVKNLKIEKDLLDTDETTLRRLITVIIELTQNMMHYSVASQDYKKLNFKMAIGNGLLLLGRQNNNFFVTCGNKIHKNQVPIIRDKLSNLQKMTSEQLNEYYIEQLNRDPLNPDEIGGLGFIQMAKKTSKPIQFEFEPLDEDNQFISITGHIKGGKL